MFNLCSSFCLELRVCLGLCVVLFYGCCEMESRIVKNAETFKLITVNKHKCSKEFLLCKLIEYMWNSRFRWSHCSISSNRSALSSNTLILSSNVVLSKLSWNTITPNVSSIYIRPYFILCHVLAVSFDGQVEGGWILEGQKRWIGNSTFADVLVIMARNTTTKKINAYVKMLYD